DAVRQGADELPADAASPCLMECTTGHGDVVDPCRPGGGYGAGRAPGDPAPVHAADPQARDLSGAAAGSRAAAPGAEAATDQELAAPAGADGAPGLDGAGAGTTPVVLPGAPGRRIGADGPRPGLRHQPVDEIQGQGQDPARRGQGPRPRNPRQDPRF